MSFDEVFKKSNNKKSKNVIYCHFTIIDSVSVYGYFIYTQLYTKCNIVSGRE